MPVALGIAARRQVARNLIGLPEEEALRIFPKCLLNGGKAAAAVLDDVLEAKRTALKTDGLLETCGAIRRYELVQLDAGALYDKYVGKSEKRLTKALDLAQKLAPVVLWIDEVEKAFAPAGTSGDADAGL